MASKIYRPAFSFEPFDASKPGHGYADGTAPRRPRCFGYGNSIMYGVGTSNPATMSIPARMSVALEPRWAASNWIGRSGWNTAQLFFEAAGDLVTYNTDAEKLRVRRVMVFLEATNDSGVYPQSIADYKAFCQARVAEGWTVLLCALLPTTSTVSGIAKTNREAFNAAIYAQCKGWGAAGIVPLDQDARLANPSDTTYYADGVHLNDAGSQVAADIAVPCVERLYVAGGIAL